MYSINRKFTVIYTKPIHILILYVCIQLKTYILYLEFVSAIIGKIMIEVSAEEKKNILYVIAWSKVMTYTYINTSHSNTTFFHSTDFLSAIFYVCVQRTTYDHAFLYKKSLFFQLPYLSKIVLSS